jgi:hypothetical protein
MAKPSKKIISSDMKGYVFLDGFPLVLAFIFWKEINPEVLLLGIPLTICLILKWLSEKD